MNDDGERLGDFYQGFMKTSNLEVAGAFSPQEHSQVYMDIT